MWIVWAYLGLLAIGGVAGVAIVWTALRSMERKGGGVIAYLILSLKHTGSVAMWWGPDCCGYTNNIEAAGLYTRQQADQICSPSDYQDSMPVPVEAAYADLRAMRVVDLGDAGNRAVVERWSLEQAKKGGRG